MDSGGQTGRWPDIVLKPDATIEIDSQIREMESLPSGGAMGRHVAGLVEHSEDSQSSGGVAYPSITVVAGIYPRAPNWMCVSWKGQMCRVALWMPGVAAGAAELDGEGGLSSADNHATSSSDGLVQTNLRGWLL